MLIRNVNVEVPREVSKGHSVLELPTNAEIQAKIQELQGVAFSRQNKGIKTENRLADQQLDDVVTVFSQNLSLEDYRNLSIAKAFKDPEYMKSVLTVWKDNDNNLYVAFNVPGNARGMIYTRSTGYHAIIKEVLTRTQGYQIGSGTHPMEDLATKIVEEAAKTPPNGHGLFLVHEWVLEILKLAMKKKKLAKAEEKMRRRNATTNEASGGQQARRPKIHAKSVVSQSNATANGHETPIRTNRAAGPTTTKKGVAMPTPTPQKSSHHTGTVPTLGSYNLEGLPPKKMVAFRLATAESRNAIFEQMQQAREQNFKNAQAEGKRITDNAHQRSLELHDKYNKETNDQLMAQLDHETELNYSIASACSEEDLPIVFSDLGLENRPEFKTEDKKPATTGLFGSVFSRFSNPLSRAKSEVPEPPTGETLFPDLEEPTFDDEEDVKESRDEDEDGEDEDGEPYDQDDDDDDGEDEDGEPYDQDDDDDKDQDNSSVEEAFAVVNNDENKCQTTGSATKAPGCECDYCYWMPGEDDDKGEMRSGPSKKKAAKSNSKSNTTQPIEATKNVTKKPPAIDWDGRPGICIAYYKNKNRCPSTAKGENGKCFRANHYYDNKSDMLAGIPSSSKRGAGR